MSYPLKVGNFSKRINSTKQPNTTSWAAYDVVLKTPCDFDNPVVTLQEEFASFAPNNYNYATFFGRFYWITGVKALRTNLLEVSMSLDILAYRKSDIMATSAFIEYGFNATDAGAAATRIADQRRPVSKNPSMYNASVDISGGVFTTTGCYILQCVTDNHGVCCYALPVANMQSLITTLNQDISDEIDTVVAGGSTGDDLLAELEVVNLKRSLLQESAMAAIKSIHWMPLPVIAAGGTQETIHLGNYNTHVNGALLSSNTVWTHTSSITIPWPVSDYKRNNCQMSLYLPFYGTIPISVDQCINSATLTILISVDFFSGDMSITVNAGSYCLYASTTNIAAPYAIGSSNVGISNTLGGGVQALGGVLTMAAGALDVGAGLAAFGATGGLMGGGSISSGVQTAAQGAMSAVSGYAQTVQPVITSAGAMGGIAALGQSLNANLTLLYYPVITDANFESLYGHPVFKVDTPVAGFCKTRGFSIAVGVEPQHVSYINQVMDGGCFIE